MFLGAWITFLIFLGIYGFNNPDKDAWLGYTQDSNKDISMKLYDNELDMKLAGATNNLHMHARLVAWFTWGFWNNLVPIMTSIVVGILYKTCNATFASVFWATMGCLTCCSSLGWFVTGIIWRWSSDAQFAVGTLVPSGKTPEEWKAVTEADNSLY